MVVNWFTTELVVLTYIFVNLSNGVLVNQWFVIMAWMLPVMHFIHKTFKELEKETDEIKKGQE